ncbi:hypothetical protein BH23GEM9_BH23GEM9_26810 [soil metagenome]
MHGVQSALQAGSLAVARLLLSPIFRSRPPDPDLGRSAVTTTPDNPKSTSLYCDIVTSVVATAFDLPRYPPTRPDGKIGRPVSASPSRDGEARNYVSFSERFKHEFVLSIRWRSTSSDAYAGIVDAAAPPASPFGKVARNSV